MMKLFSGSAAHSPMGGSPRLTASKAASEKTLGKPCEAENAKGCSEWASPLKKAGTVSAFLSPTFRHCGKPLKLPWPPFRV